MRATIDRLRAARRDQGGFTLIELLIVIIILGILAAVVVFSIAGITDNGEQAACETEVRIVDTAIEAYRAEIGSYPTALSDLEGQFLKSDLTGYVTSIAGTPPAAVASC